MFKIKKNMKLDNVVVISKEDYERFQALEAKEKESKKDVDYSRLKTGSKVMIKYTDQLCSVNVKVDYNLLFEVVFFKEKHFIDQNRIFNKEGYQSIYCTFYQNGKYILYSAETKLDYITEVIEY